MTKIFEVILEALCIYLLFCIIITLFPSQVQATISDVKSLLQ